MGEKTLFQGDLKNSNNKLKEIVASLKIQGL
jgi:hypothetical protein